MTTLRSYIDHNQQTHIPAAAPIMTDNHQHEVRCGMCARELYVDDEGYSLYMEAMNSGLDNPFRCEICNEEYDDLVYEG
jgi:translation initiation factor 2 gamma subunit (eIF-2gamma)